MADVLSGDSATTYIPQSADRGLFVFIGGGHMEQATVTKKMTITLDIITGNIDIVHDDMTYHELLGALELAKSIVMRDLIREME